MSGQPQPRITRDAGDEGETGSARANTQVDDAEPNPNAQRLTVTAVHASLEHAEHPLIIGHYVGVALDGAGAFLDARLEGRLSRAIQLGQFPERAGESVIIENPLPVDQDRAYPPGALVVGLGAPGELTREVLTTCVADAMLRCAIEVSEKAAPPDGRPQLTELPFSALPVGTSTAGGISTETCVAAMIDAAISVNDRLFREPPVAGRRTWDSVRVARLELVSLWEDRAELVAHAVRRAADLLQFDARDYREHTRLVLSSRLIPREGALRRRPQSEERAGEWQRLIIRDQGREPAATASAGDAAQEGATETESLERDRTVTLEFTAVGGRARADRVGVVVDAETVESMIQRATDEPERNDALNRTLFELLLPTAFKPELLRFDNLQFIVDENTADFPWEVLAAGRDREIGLHGGLLRHFQEYEGTRVNVRAPVGQRVLVIGNPPAEPLPPLPGARAEALKVAETLKEGFSVRALIWGVNGELVRDDFKDLIGGSSGQRILNALFTDEWRIVHIASHGRYDAADTSRSGAVIEHDAYITANVVEQLPVVPEMVFLNACHLGHVTDTATGPRQQHRLAASVARQLMRIGVRAVVAAGWAVQDAPAELFAAMFYKRLLEGALLGDAVHGARVAVDRAYPKSMTWGAYQCYGDPSYRLREGRRTNPLPLQFVGQKRNESAGEDMPFVSEAELVRRVQTISALASKVGLPTFDDLSDAESELGEELCRFQTALATDEWSAWASASTYAELGAAFGELGRYADAVACYRKAWNKGESDVGIKVLEQLGNLEIRLAERLNRGDVEADVVTTTLQPDASTAPELVRSAEDHLEQALGIGATGERLALLGSYHKKAATMTDDPADKARHLEASCARYRAAHEWYLRKSAEKLGGGRAKVSTYYPFVWMQMAVLAGDEIDETLAEVVLEAIEWLPGSPTVELDDAGRPTAAVEPGTDATEMPDDYWTRLARANAALTRGVLHRSIDVGALSEAFHQAFRTRSSKRNRDSTIDHLRDLASLMQDDTLHQLADQL